MLLFLLIALINYCTVHAEPASVYFINFSTLPMKLFWFDQGSKAEVYLFDVPPYHSASTDTQTGHSFSYYFGKSKERNVMIIDNDNEQHPTYLVAPNGDVPSSINVQCSTTTGDMHAVIKPAWSPHGAARFLELVDMGYFTGCALNRVVKGFLTQFGISADYDLRTKYRQENIPDDTPIKKVLFEPGFLSYAGSGPNSRSTEVFVVMPDAPQNQLEYFGASNPWETPFGYVIPKDLDGVVGNWHSYGDMPPWGQGPNPQQIYQKGGYEQYLKKEFPEMSYIQSCTIVGSTAAGR